MTLALSVPWRRSSYSNGMGGECVEVAARPAVIAVRDSKAPSGPHITMGARPWAAFLDAVHSGNLS
ncbi:DUF397 domain-containing protein [Streptomyces sp. Je 1-332]|uniref:DUF397 domain-containing protein n=1 Tax=unclassified Streptomyces TaxID=2593676 RepID=UPI003458154E